MLMKGKLYSVNVLRIQWMLILAAYIFFSDVVNAKTTAREEYHYEIKRFTVPVDHFNYASNDTFQIRYLINNTYSAGDISPIFFYTGNEGDIEIFAQNTGFMWELAQQFRASVVFAEHRYYGQSLPFGENTFNTTESIQHLNVEQTLEDFVSLINFLTMTSKSVPVIAFGGSYGGMLAAWLRMKYPHIVNGALAASAPIWQFNDVTPCDIFAKITTSVYTNAYNKNCSLNIQNSWQTFKNFFASEEGKNSLNNAFKVCHPIRTNEDFTNFLDYLEDVYTNLAMANYPYSNEFLAPLPAYPVREVCYKLKDLYKSKSLLNAISDAIGIYTNYTGTLKCLDYTSIFDSSLGGLAWEVQTCNELVMPMCSHQNDTMFRDKEWNFSKYSENCKKKFKTSPKINDILARYGGKRIRYASNIIFSNGLQDPWSGGGVLQYINDKIYVIIIPEGAHHLDLRNSNPADPQSVIDARSHEAEIIGSWITEFYKGIMHF